MEPYESAVFLKLLRLEPKLRDRYETAAARLKAERVANPPGPGNLRKLKKQAEREVMTQVYEELKSDATGSRRYDTLYAKCKGATTRA